MLAATMALAGCVSREYAQASGQGWVDFTITTKANLPPSASLPPYSLTVTSADNAYSHTWPLATDYPKFEPYTVGKYFAKAFSGEMGAEGYDCPCFAGETTFEVIEAKYTNINIDCFLTQAVIYLTVGDALRQACPDAMVTLHSAGHSYVEADRDAESPVFLTPGSTYLYVTVNDGMGGKATVAPDFKIDTRGSESYSVTVDMAEDEVLQVSCGDIVSRMPISAALFQSAPPSIEARGFVSGSMVNIVEGYPASEPLIMVVNAPAGLSAAVLTSVSDHEELPSECDLLGDPASLLAHGLIVDRVDDETLMVDFTRLLENVGVPDKSYFTFMLQARDRLNRVSEASMLRVAIKSVEVEAVGKPTSVVGTDFATIDVSLSSSDFNVDDFDVYIIDAHDNIISEANIIDFRADNEAMTASIDFNVEPGLDDIDVRVDFMGNPKLYATVERVVPEYEIFVDAFAMAANIYVTTEDKALRDIIVQDAIPYVNETPAIILNRDVDDGYITISQLSPATAYSISTVLIPNRYAPLVRVATEKAEQVPSGDFEEFEDLIQYKRLACGGAYSNTVFPIFNMQNYTDIDVKWPQKHWAGTDAKTFCKSASLHNTWYMYPSAMLDFSMSASGSKSMLVQSVGWSLDGDEITPYIQESGKQLAYNANVPNVAHRSAGKAFLGSYRFDPATLTEVYDQGVAFTSRPRSLNGFYQYVSDVTTPDNGLVIVELVNDAGPEPISVATATMRFTSSASFTSFSLPLSYHTIGVKATKLRIMFSSTYRQGDIGEEDDEVPVTADASRGMFIGSILRVDNLSFSY